MFFIEVIGLEKCVGCPRHCNVDRSVNKGFCGVDHQITVSRAAPHYWEEPSISGEKGSGAIFFSGCNLKCVFCQNASISGGGIGKPLTESELAALMLRLQNDGVHNINLVTPSHFTNQIVLSIDEARQKGLSLPMVWNSNAYELAEEIRHLQDKVDIYLPDFKYKSPALSARYSCAPDYFEVAVAALDEMVLQRGGVEFDGDLMRRGVIVRHLLLPGCIDDSKRVLSFLHRRYGNAIYISVMSQYTPVGKNLPDSLGRPLTAEEYDEIKAYALRIGITQGYFQEGDAVGESFIPSFDLTGV